MTHTTYSPTAIQLTQHAEQLFSPLIQQGMFDNFERALRMVLLKYVDEQILVYKKRVSQFEVKYQKSFEDFSDSLKNQATPEQEDVWMDWEVALTFLHKWQQIHAQVMKSNVA